MSDSPINLSPHLKRLRDEGYEIEIVAGHLAVRNVPYVNSAKQVRRGTLVSELSLAGNVAQQPSTHVIMFAGELPCDKHGRELAHINDKTAKKISDTLTVNYSFSSKPPEGNYPDYYEKVTAYVALLTCQAQAIDRDADARTWRVIENDDPDSPFNYIDTASSRAGITALSRKLALSNVAILGLGGTGSYVLDLVAKTPVSKIHLFDGDKFGQHNAFRSPGAPTIEELRVVPFKVDHWAGIYSRMHRGIVPHRFHMDASKVDMLRDMEFVFVCADAGSAKVPIVEKLEEFGIPFVDTGMGLELVDDCLDGVLTVTTSTKKKRDHFRRRVSFSGDGHENIYAQNIQVADLNAFNASFAVIKWKKLRTFYVDYVREHFTTYTIDGNSLASEDRQ